MHEDHDDDDVVYCYSTFMLLQHWNVVIFPFRIYSLVQYSAKNEEMYIKHNFCALS